jgi:WD40 repeat protein
MGRHFGSGNVRRILPALGTFLLIGVAAWSWITAVADPLSPPSPVSARATATAVEQRFVDRGEFVEDRKTGLLWQKDGDDSGKLNFYQAAEYAAKLKLGGMTGWRVPTKEELSEIFPATQPPFVDTRYTEQPCCDGPHQWNSYWTSNLDPRMPDYAYVYQWYAKGGANNGYASKNFVLVRCVHDSLVAFQGGAGGSENQPVSISINGGQVVATTSEPDVELTVAERGKLLKIVDGKTGQRLTFQTRDFAFLVGDGNSVRVSGDSATVHRGETPIVQIRRGTSATETVPATLSSATPSANQPAAPGMREVVAAAASPDGRLLATAHLDRSVRVWDTATGQEMCVAGEQNESVKAICFAGEGREVIRLGDRIWRFFDATTGRTLRSFGGNIGEIHLATVSPDGRRMLTAAPRQARVWTMANIKAVTTLEHHMDFVTAAMISADGRRGLCTGGYYQNSDTPLAEVARVWDLDTGKLMFELTPRVRAGVRGALSPDGRLVAALDVGDTHRLCLWDVDTGERIRSCDTTRTPQQLVFSADGQRLASLTGEQALEVFSVASGQRLATFTIPRGSIRFVAWSAEGNALVGCDGTTIRRWQLPGAAATEVKRPAGAASPERRRFLHDAAVYTVAFLHSGKRALSSGFDGTLRLWDVETGEEVKRFTADHGFHMINHLAISPDDHYALLGGGVGHGSQGLTLWDLQSWSAVRRFPGVESVVTCVAFSPDGRLVLCGGTEGSIQTWEVETGRQLKEHRPGVRGARSVDVARDGRTAVFAGGQRDFRLRLWNVSSGEEVRSLSGHSGSLVGAFYTIAGKTIVSASQDQTIRLWDAESGKEMRSIREPSPIRCLAISRDGRYAVVGCGDGTVAAWDLQTGNATVRFTHHTDQVTSVAVSPDNRWILSGSYDRTVRLWPLAPPEAKKDEASSASPMPRQGAVLEEHGARLGRDRDGNVISVNLDKSLQEDDVAELARLPKLATLYVHEIRDADLARIKHFTTLYSLQISKSEISDAGFAEIKSLSKLRTLSIYSSRITDDGLAHLAALPLLRNLSLSQSKITGTGLSQLHGLAELEDLSLSSSPVTNDGLKELSAFPNLAGLHLGKCPQIGDEGLKTIGKLSKLRTLEIHDTGVTNEGLANLAGLSRLHALGLANTNITDEGLRHLDSLQNLTVLWLNDVDVSDAAVERLRQKLPKLKQVFGKEKKKATPD